MNWGRDFFQLSSNLFQQIVSHHYHYWTIVNEHHTTFVNRSVIYICQLVWSSPKEYNNKSTKTIGTKCAPYTELFAKNIITSMMAHATQVDREKISSPVISTWYTHGTLVYITYYSSRMGCVRMCDMLWERIHSSHVRNYLASQSGWWQKTC